MFCIVRPLFPADDVKCLAKAIYYEASNQSLKGKQAIAFVLFNRSDKYNVGICRVIQKNLGGPFRFQKRKFDRKQYQEALEIAEEMYLNRDEYEDPTHSALYFHTVRGGKRKWTKKLVRTVRIQDHVFFKDPY
jgi:spore germination cell wall hydrolase CwlJ-like protein